MAELMESIAGNLQQRIGQLVSQYETDMAVLKANASAQLDQKNEELKKLQEALDKASAELESLKENSVPEEATDKPTDTAKS